MIFINFVFRILNFIVLAGLFYYMTKKSLIPLVMKMIAAYDIFIRKLKDDYQNVQSDCQSISEKTDFQEKQFQAIQLKFLLWQEKCQHQKLLSIAEQQRIEQAIQERFDVRSQVVMNELAIKEQLPYILDQATEQLQDKYHIIDSQKMYIEELIHVMKERS